MIEVKYYRKKHKVTVVGHAKSGEAGHDLVCAAVSILTYTLATNVAQLGENKRYVRRPILRLKEGNAEISCSPVHGMSNVTTIIFDSICSGFNILSVQYPKNISYDVID